MKPPPARGMGSMGGGKQLDKVDTSNLVRFSTTRNSIAPDDATAIIREIAFHRHVDHLHRRNPIAFTPWSVWCDPNLDNEIRTNLRRLWWQFRREGVRLPAEHGVIMIDGGA